MSATMPLSETRPSPEAFQIDVQNLCHVASLPKSVRQKWRNSEPSKESTRDTTTHADLDFRLQKAEERRAGFRQWLLRKRPRSDSKRSHHQMLQDIKAKKLEQKLADAAANRRVCLETVRSKATAMLQRSELVAERFNERQVLLAQKLSETLNAAETRRLALLEAEKERLSAAHELISSRKVQVQEKEEQERAENRKLLGEKLNQADSARLAKLAATAARAGDKVRHAKHVSKMRRLNEAKDAQEKRSFLTSKLQTAENRRHEDCTVRVVINAEKSESKFLKSQATKKAKLLRSGTSRKLQMVWKSFKDRNKTTRALAQQFLHTGVTFLNVTDDMEETSMSESDSAISSYQDSKDPFEEFASRLQAKSTINSAQALLGRMKMKFLGKCEGIHDCTPMLKRLFHKTPKSKLERYPTRIFLCAYMILNHPEVVFNVRGEREAALSAASKEMVYNFEQMLERCLLPTMKTQDHDHDPDADADDQQQQGSGLEVKTLARLFNAFDDKWVAYLEQFVAWKSHDASALANSLIKMAAKMQLSMLRKVEGDINSERVQQTPDLKNIVEQVQHDHQLLKERVERLTGQSGIAKFNKAIMGANRKYKDEVSDTSQTSEASGSRLQSQEVHDKNQGGSGEGSSSEQNTSINRNENQQQPPDKPPSSLMDLDEASSMSKKTANESFVWELLYNRHYQLSSDRIDEIWTAAVSDSIKLESYAMTNDDVHAPSEALQKQINAIMEKAFWDTIESKLSVEGAGAVQACTMLLEIGSELAEILPNNASSKILKDHLKDEGELLKLLQGDEKHGLETSRLLHVMDHTSDLLREFGSGARNDAVMEAQKKVREKIENALILELEDEKRIALAKAITHALRLLYAQLKVLRFDMANAKIRALSCTLDGPQAIHYIREKFFQSHSLTRGTEGGDQDPKEKLPKLKKWVDKTSEIERNVGLTLQPFLVHDSSKKNHVPSFMHSGIIGSGAHCSSSSSSAGQHIIEQWDEVRLVPLVELGTWRASVRVGLVDLVTSSLPLAGVNVPETFILDATRLQKIQNCFERLIVISASILAIRQARQDAKKALENDEILLMKSRLGPILDHPSTNLSILTSELAKMAGSSELEPFIHSTLANLTNREKGGFKALHSSFIKALILCLINTDSTDIDSTKRAVDCILSKIGSTFLVEDVMEIAKDLSFVTGVNEAIYSEIYKKAFSHQ